LPTSSNLYSSEAEAEAEAEAELQNTLNQSWRFVQLLVSAAGALAVVQLPCRGSDLPWRGEE